MTSTHRALPPQRQAGPVEIIARKSLPCRPFSVFGRAGLKRAYMSAVDLRTCANTLQNEKLLEERDKRAKHSPFAEAVADRRLRSHSEGAACRQF